jgi:hypothetical protein
MATPREATLRNPGPAPSQLVRPHAQGRAAGLLAATLNWIVNEKKIAPHIPVIDKSKREDSTFSREDFTFNKDRDVYICPAGKSSRPRVKIRRADFAGAKMI